MKIGIMTWYTYHNYGTALQATALYHSICNLGYQPSLIQYKPKGGWAIPKKISGKWLLKKLSEKVKHRNRIYSSAEREQLFFYYLKSRITESPVCNSYPELHDLNTQYDAFVCGSDQIWSPLCYDDKYFLSFVEEPEKMIAYAASIGSVEIQNTLVKRGMKENISRFVHLAVRERQGADLIKSLTGKLAKVVLDPTLLLDCDEWDVFAAVASSPKIKGDGYGICYFLGDARRYMAYVQALSKQMDLPFYVIPVTIKDKKNNNVVPFEVGPGEFVSLIRNAKYVCTDSYHGMTFSINYNVPFNVFKRFADNDPKDQNSRIISLLEILKLKDRLVDPQKTSDPLVNLTCRFEDANAVLDEQRRESLAYLEKALSDATTLDQKRDHSITPYKITDMCCGCGACACVCPKAAISISKDTEGFEHSLIDAELCVRCGLCKIVCPMTNISAGEISDSKALYAVKSKSYEVIKSSSSGGVGYEISTLLQDEGFFVSGCTYDATNNTAEHILICPEEKEKLALLQGSKYIQSISSHALHAIGQMTTEQKLVFFGTPCQTAAVDKMLKQSKRRENAVLVDLICHGVPSYYLWQKYLRDIDQNYHTGKNPQVNFRSKEREWRRRLLLLTGNEHTYKKPEDKDHFYAFFRRGLCYMKSCSDCPYREKSAADLRIGDYWGSRYEKDQQGVSMVISNTDVGQDLIAKLRDSCAVQQHELTEYWTVQYPYNSLRPPIREQLIFELKEDKKPLHVLRKEYCGYYDFREKASSVKQILKKAIRHGDSYEK